MAFDVLFWDEVSTQFFGSLRNATTVIKVLIAVYCLFAKELSSLREQGATNATSVCRVYNQVVMESSPSLSLKANAFSIASLMSSRDGKSDVGKKINLDSRTFDRLIS